MEKERTTTHIKRISESFCKEIPDDIDLIYQVEIMYWNLWAQFGILKQNITLIERLKLRLSDFTWTKTARNSFYKLEDHKRVYKLLKKDDRFADWSDTCEPIISRKGL